MESQVTGNNQAERREENMISRRMNSWIFVLVIIMAGFMIFSYSSYGESECKEIQTVEQLNPIVCDPIIPNDPYTFQLKADGFEGAVKWEYLYGIIPYGIELKQTGELVGTLKGDKKELVGKEYEFYVIVKAKDKKNEDVSYKFKVIITTESSKNKLSTTSGNGTDTTRNYYKPTEQLRMILGYEVIRSSGDTSKNNAFFDMYFSQPFPGVKDSLNRYVVWGNLRLTSLPTNSTIDIKELPEPNSNLEQITQAGELLVGLEINIGKLISPNDKYKYTFGLTLSGGAIVPLTSPDETVLYFKIPSDQLADYPGKKYFALVPPKFNRFYHQYYAGIRFKTYDSANDNLPATFDLMIGSNSATSGGDNKFFKKKVLRFDGFLPINFIKDNMIYIFGSLIINLNKRSRIPFTIGKWETADLNEDNILPSEVETQNIPEYDRDYYRIGIGVSLSKIFE